MENDSESLGMQVGREEEEEEIEEKEKTNESKRRRKQTKQLHGVDETKSKRSTKKYIRRAAANEQLGREIGGDRLHALIVDQTGDNVDVVRHRLKVDRRGADLLLAAVEACERADGTGRAGRRVGVRLVCEHDIFVNWSEASKFDSRDD